MKFKLNFFHQKEKNAFMKYQMNKKSKKNNQTGQNFRKRIEKLEAKKWLKAEFRVTGRVLKGQEQFYELFGTDFLDIESKYKDFKKFFFSSDIMKFSCMNYLFE